MDGVIYALEGLTREHFVTYSKGFDAGAELIELLSRVKDLDTEESDTEYVDEDGVKWDKEEDIGKIVVDPGYEED